jgi:hypothetical protein
VADRIVHVRDGSVVAGERAVGGAT